MSKNPLIFSSKLDRIKIVRACPKSKKKNGQGSDPFPFDNDQEGINDDLEVDV